MNRHSYNFIREQLFEAIKRPMCGMGGTWGACHDTWFDIRKEGMLNTHRWRMAHSVWLHLWVHNDRIWG
jgi:hypothetical protein